MNILDSYLIEFNSVIVDGGATRFASNKNIRRLKHQVFENYKGSKQTVIVVNYPLLLSNKSIKVFRLIRQTQGALASAALGACLINEKSIPILICPANSLISRKRILEFVLYMKCKNTEVGSMIFPSQNKKFSYIRIQKSGEVIEVAEKRVIGTQALAGVFYFRNVEIFLKASAWTFERNIRMYNKFYVAPMLNYFISENINIDVFPIAKKEYIRLENVRK